jgi:hypothetical protein
MEERLSEDVAEGASAWNASCLANGFNWYIGGLSAITVPGSSKSLLARNESAPSG